MSKMTLLDMVQDILSDLESDEVNSIDDSFEATQIAQIIKSTYNSIIDSKDWPFLFQFFKLEASGTSTKPTHMKLPENVTNVDSIRYNKRKATDTYDKFENVIYKSPDDFLVLINSRFSDSVDIMSVVDATGITLNILNNKAPTYYTSFDDEYLIFDSYDSALENTLQVSKTQCHGTVRPTFEMVDSFIPDLPIQMFSYLLNESKSICFLIIKQAPNPKAEQHSITQRRKMSQNAWRLNRGISYPDYGRKRNAAKKR